MERRILQLKSRASIKEQGGTWGDLAFLDKGCSVLLILIQALHFSSSVETENS